MRNRSLLLGLSLLGGCSSTPDTTSIDMTSTSLADMTAAPADLSRSANSLEVMTDKGVVIGKNEQLSRAFLGIPYAAPPIGDLRWRSPQPAAAWTSARDAKAYGPICPQFDLLGGGFVSGASEDCLTINVWTPQTVAAPRAVMVWVHGGGFVFGSSADSAYDGASLSAGGDVVVVSFNYRLGALGFLAHPALTAEDATHPGSGNWGIASPSSP